MDKQTVIHPLDIAIKQNDLQSQERKEHGGILNILLSEEASLKILHTVRFQLYDILEKGETIKTAKRSVVAKGSK